MRAAAILTFDKCLYLMGQTTANREQYRRTTKLLLQTYVNIACVWASRCERVCVSKSTCSMHTYSYTVHRNGVISCFRLLWCVLQLQWENRYTENR